MTTNCPACDYENRDEARFCAGCGSALPSPCPACGAVPLQGADFCDSCGARLSHAAVTAGKNQSPALERGAEVPVTDAERRHLTVLFCDLVGSTRLTEDLDPEEFRELLADYQDCCAGVVSHYDGVIARYVGDGLLIYFGYPHAHEDDAVRAVRAALDMVNSVAGMEPRIELPVAALSVRIGIATGNVVVGDIGSGARREEMAVVGEAPNLAARLQSLAEPGEVLIGKQTFELVKGYFEVDERGERDLKGISREQRIYQVRAVSGAVDRLDARARTGLTPLVGRREEVAILSNRWRKALQGESQLVTVSGEAGIGKSRIVRAFRETIAGEPHSRVLYYGSPYHHNSAFHPIIDQLERALRFNSDDNPKTRLEKIESEVARLGLDVESIVPPVAALLSLATEDKQVDIVEAGDLKRRQLESLCAMIEAMSTENPILMIAEDVHWYDPSSLEMLTAFKQRLNDTRLLIVITHRPDFSPPLSGVTNHTQLPLGNLGGIESNAIVTQVAGNKPLPEEVATEIIAKTDGIPLFVEELTKSLLESGVLRDDGKAYVLDNPLPPLAIPPSLQDSLMARLDRLATTKEIAQLAACIGREFDFALLSAVVSIDDTELANALEQLTDAGLIYLRGIHPEIKYEFKHTLVRDAAYNSLLKSTRQLNHQRIAQALEYHFAALSDTQPEFVAKHYTEAGLAGSAASWWYRAGQRATRMDANLEASQHFEQGLEMIEKLDQSEENIRLEADLTMALANSIRVIEGYGTERAGELFARSRSLRRQIFDKGGEFPALWGMWGVAMASGELDKARDYAGDVLALAEEIGDPNLELEAHHASWGTYSILGDQFKVRHHSERGIELYRFEDHGEYGFTYGNHDVGVCARYSNAQALWLLGYPDQARARIAEALELIDRHSQPQFVSHGLIHCCVVYMLLGDVDAVRDITSKARPLTIETGNADLAVHCEFALGWILLREGNFPEGIAKVNKTLTDGLSGANYYNSSFYFCTLADACFNTNLHSEGRGYLRQALDYADKSSEHWWLAEIHRLDAKAHLETNDRDPKPALKSLQTALDISRRQEAKMLELRAACDMSRFLRHQGDSKRAYELLAPVYEWFTEGLETDELRTARTLLGELSS